MAYTFANGEVATAAKLNLIIGATTQAGVVKVTPVANTPTTVHVTFPKAFTSIPVIVVTAQSTVPGTSVVEVASSGRTSVGFDVVLYRINTATTTVAWQAWQDPVQFITGQPITASLLNQGATGMVAQVGGRVITPVANTPTNGVVTFTTPFASTPTVVTCANSAAPGSEILGTSATEVDESGFKAWITRTNTTASTVNWIALGRI